MNTITYSKRFETFEDGLREITDLVPMVKEYMFTGDAAKFDSVLDDGIFKRDDLEGYIITNLINHIIHKPAFLDRINLIECTCDMESYS